MSTVHGFFSLFITLPVFLLFFSLIPFCFWPQHLAVLFLLPCVFTLTVESCILLSVVGCAKTKCKFYSKCEEKSNGQAVCVCEEKCAFLFVPVCGSNGKTYINQCLLKVDSCKQRRSIVVLQNGACSKLRTAHYSTDSISLVTKFSYLKHFSELIPTNGVVRNYNARSTRH